MKKEFTIISYFSKNYGYGNLIRSKNLFFYLKKKYITNFFLISNTNNFVPLKKKFKFIKKIEHLKFNKHNKNYVFIDMPKINSKIIKIIKKIKYKKIFYGNSDYKLFNKYKIYPFKQGTTKPSMYYAIINDNQKSIKYENLKKLIFFIYFGKRINHKIYINIIKSIIKVFPKNKIIIFDNSYLNKKKINKIYSKIYTVKSFEKFYNNMVFIGNCGSGAYNRINSGMISFNFSYNFNEKKIGRNLNKLDKNFYYLGELSKFKYKKFQEKIKFINKITFPYKSKKIGIFKNNNKIVEKLIISKK